MGNKINIHKRCTGIAMVILLVLGVNYSLRAQQYYEKAFDINNGVEHANFMLNYNDSENYLLGSFKNVSGTFDILLSKTDSNSNIQWTKKYYDGTNIQANDLIKTSDSSLIINCYSVNSQNRGSSILIKVDLNGDTIWSRKYRNQFGGVNLKQLNIIGDTIFYYGSINTDSLSSNILSGIIVGISNMTGSILYSKSFKLASHLSTSFAVAKADHTGSSDKYWILGYSFTDLINYISDCFLIKLDLNKSTNNVTIIADSLTVLGNYNLDISDDQKELIGFASMDTLQIEKYCFAELDSSLNVLWAKKYWNLFGSPSYKLSKYLSNNSGFLTSLGFYITKMDNNGNILKISKIYLDPSKISPFVVFNQVSNSKDDILWLGELRWGNSINYYNMLLVKTNSDGYGCIDNNQAIPNIDSISLFPQIDTTLIANNFPLQEYVGIFYTNTNLTTISECTTTSLNEIVIKNEKSITCVRQFPSSIFIDGLDQFINYNISIYNVSGQNIFKNLSSNTTNLTIPTSQYQSGLYLVSVQSLSAGINVFKIIIN